MSTQLPLRRLRIPALQRQQCLFQRHPHSRPQYLALDQSARRAFSATHARPAKRTQFGQSRSQIKAMAQSQVGPSPSVNFNQAQMDAGALADDIGLLQNTIVKAPFSELKGVGLGGLAKYYWGLLKSKGTAWYSRSVYRRCMQKTGWTRFLPADLNNQAQIKDSARKYYEQLYLHLASGNVSPLKNDVLPPLFSKLQARIVARGGRQIDWRLHPTSGGKKFRSARIVSHRAAPIGEDTMPDTAYRQVVVRLESLQSITRLSRKQSKTTTTTTTSTTGRPNTTTTPSTWLPDAVRRKAEASRQRVQKLVDEEGDDWQQVQSEAFPDDGVPKKVVEYFVLQKRVVRGKEEPWKVWGFTEESTPESIAEDEEYWRKTLDMQTAQHA